MGAGAGDRPSQQQHLNVELPATLMQAVHLLQLSTFVVPFHRHTQKFDMDRLDHSWSSILSLAVLSCLTFVTNASAEPSSSSAEAAISELLDEVWDFELNQSPLLATDVGDARGQNHLSDMSIQSIELRHRSRIEFLGRLSEIDSSQLSKTRRIDHELLRHRLEGQLADHRFQLHLTPINNREGFHVTLGQLADLMSPDSPDDLSNYISRLRDIPRVVDEHIDLMRGGIEADLTQPAIILREIAKQVRGNVVASADQSSWKSKLDLSFLDSSDEQQKREFLTALDHAIETSAMPAYAKFAEFLEQEYVPACRGSVGASALPDGRAFYRDRIARFTTLEMTAEELHSTGIRENARIRDEMEKIRLQVKFEGDLAAFIEHLRTDPKYYAKSPEELLSKVAMILKTADGQLPKLFGRLPRIPYGIRPVPDFVAPQTTSAYYWPPSTDGTRAGFYYVNTYNLPARPIYQLESLSLHEAVPGHHLQLALQAEIADLHPMSRQSSITAFIEGWALYSERLGHELGFFVDPYQHFGRLSMEAWRASRLVVDTGIHAMGWSRRQAIEYMLENTALSEHNVVAEVDRYIGWPGQALAYKVGELAITGLRKRAEDRLGDGFDVRDFHDLVLEFGAIPLPLLESRVDSWIERRIGDQPDQ